MIYRYAIYFDAVIDNVHSSAMGMKGERKGVKIGNMGEEQALIEEGN